MIPPRPTLLSLCLVLAAASSAYALDPTKQITQYGHTAWRVKDGLLGGLPVTLAQTTDGYIWIGTRTGLLRFDGVRFVPWSHGGEEATLGVSALLPTRDGGLWIGWEGGLSHLKDGRVTRFPAAPGPVVAIAQTPDGMLWFVHPRRDPNVGALCQLTGTAVRCFDESDGITDTLIMALAVDRAGDLWLGGERTLFHGKPGRFRAYALDGLSRNTNMPGVGAIAQGSGDSVWVGLLAGRGPALRKLVGDAWTPVAPAFMPPRFISALFVDSDGGLWIGTVNEGIYRLHGDTVQRFGRADGLSGDMAVQFQEDREGTLWVVTTEGIDQFRELRVTSHSQREGLGSAEIDGVFTSRDGAVWIGGAGSLDVMRDGQVRSIQTGRGLPGDQVTSLFEDRGGRLWVGIDGTLRRYDNGRFTRVDLPDGRQVSMVTSMTEDTSGNLWAAVAGPPRAILRIRDGVVRESFPAPTLPATRRVAAAPDGSLWLGLIDGDLARWRDGKVEVLRFKPEPMPRVGSPMNQVLARRDGAILGATGYGLIGWKEGTRRTLTVANGLPCNQVFALVDDIDDNLWLYAECGVLQLGRDQLRQWWADGAVVLRPRVLDIFDGAQAGWAPFPAAGRSPDGRLWFANNIVLQEIDPARLNDRALPPPVHIEEIVADRARHAPSPGLTLPPLTRDLQITYTAPSFVVPQKVRFRYKLEGHDPDWIEAGTRREAFYGDLPPGGYVFRVKASNHDGVWNESGARIDFSVAPAWYEMRSFRAASVGFVFAALGAAYRIRVRRVAATLGARFDERLRERTHLARDLHDTLLQTIQASKLLVDTRLLGSADLEEMRRAGTKVSKWLEQAVLEGRAALNSLRSHQFRPGDLPNVLRKAAAEAQAEVEAEAEAEAEADLANRDSSMVASVQVIGSARDLHPVVGEEVASIGREAIRNACLHSGGTRLEVEVVYDANLTLHVRDNGVGIDASLASHGKEGHFGLQGMRERAAGLGATLKLTNVNSGGSGTEVTVVVPGSVAFRQLRRHLAY